MILNIGKNMLSVIEELKTLGITERKLLNYLKKYRDEVRLDKKKTKENDLKFSPLINGLLFDGRFDIQNPSSKLLHYISNLKKEYSSGFVYYALTEILDNLYYKDGRIHTLSDDDKSNFLMFYLNKNKEIYIRDYNNINNIQYDYNIEYEEGEEEE